MDQRSHSRKNRNSSKLLFVVMIGFCILAIIEILYGQAQIRMERERLAIEEENNRALQELKAEWNNLMGDPGVGSESVEVVGAADEKQDEVKPIENERKYDMQIVFMGDSILDNDRDNGGVAYQIMETCNAQVYNMSMGGTTAALMPGEQYNYDNWNSRSLLGVVNAILGNIDPGIFDGYRAGEILKECDFSKTDYFVIEYGINDFLSRQIPRSKYLADGGVLDVDEPHTYVGALKAAVSMLQNNFPNAKILVFSPHYCQFFEGETFIGDAYSLDYGYGSLIDFYKSAKNTAEQEDQGTVIFYDTVEESGIDAYTADWYLEDGVHLSEEGRKIYADYASKLILADFYREE